jgi:hypothetical protein
MSPIIEESILSVTIPILIAGHTDTISIELKEEYQKLTGVYVAKPTPTFTKFPVMNQFVHDGNTDVFGDDFPLEHLVSSENLSPDERFKKLDLKANKKKLKITVTDAGFASSYPYDLIFIYRLQK